MHNGHLETTDLSGLKEGVENCALEIGTINVMESVIGLCHLIIWISVEEHFGLW
jgi:hypothetical protein